MNYEKYIIDTDPFCKPDYEDTDGKIGYSLGFGSEELCNLGERFTRVKRSDVSMIEGKETPFFSAHASVGNLWVACGVSGSHRDVRYNIDKKDVHDWNDFIRCEINHSTAEKLTPEGGKLRMNTESPQQHFVNWIHSLTGVELDLSDESMCVLHKILCNLARALFGTKN